MLLIVIVIIKKVEKEYTKGRSSCYQQFFTVCLLV